MTNEEKEKLIEAIEWEKGSYLDNELYDYGAIAMANRIIEIVKEMKTEPSTKITVNQNGKNCTTIENVGTITIK